MANNVDISVVNKFSEHIEKNELTIIKIAFEIDISRNHLSLILRHQRPLCLSLRDKLNAYLGTNF